MERNIIKKNDDERGCSVDGCVQAHYCKDMCSYHYQRARKGKPLDAPYAYNKGEWGPWLKLKSGYVRRNRTVGGKQEQQLQHHFVMEQMIGRSLKPGETVHHKNAVRDDNRPENLELWIGSQPAGARLSDKLDWAKELLESYGYTVINP